MMKIHVTIGIESKWLFYVGLVLRENLANKPLFDRIEEIIKSLTPSKLFPHSCEQKHREEKIYKV